MIRNEVESNQISKSIKKVLDSLIEHGYTWDYNNCYVKRLDCTGKALIAEVIVSGNYYDFKVNFRMHRWTAGQSYSINLSYKDSKIFLMSNLHNLNEVFESYVNFSKLMNKIKNTEIISVHSFVNYNNLKNIAISCKNNIHLIFSKTNSSRYCHYQLISEGKDTDLKTLIDRVKLNDICKIIPAIFYKKIENREVISVKNFLEPNKKYMILSFQNDNHLVFLKKTGKYRSYQYEFIAEEQTTDLDSLIKKIRLINRL